VTGLAARPRARDLPQFVNIVGESGADPSHGEGRTHHDGEAELIGRSHHLVHRVADAGPRNLRGAARDACEGLDDGFELFPVLTALDGLEGCADQLAAVPVQDTVLVQRDSGVESGLAAQGGQQRVRAFPRDDTFHEFRRDGLHIGGVGEVGVGHDRGWIRIDQDHPEPLGFEDTACLGAGVVELTGLPYDDGTGTDDEDR